MQRSENGSVATRDDLIWHRLRVELVGYLVVCIVLSVSTIFSIQSSLTSKDSISGFVVFMYCIYLFVLIKIMVERFYLPSFWRRVGQRRDEALHGAQMPATPFQPVHHRHALSVPATFSLRWNKITLVVGGICSVLAIACWIITAIILLEHLDINGNGWLVLSFVCGVLFGYILIFWLFYYFVFLRYHKQRIEMTEEGLKVYYMRQERFMRWDEIRVFASYGAQWAAKSNKLRAYEVASEQMVIRWSQLPVINMFFAAQSSLDGDKDWNWLVNCLNTYIVERTGLTLLELSDKATRLSVGSMFSPARAAQISAPAQESNVVATATEPVGAPIAQDDTLVKRLQWNGELGNVFKMFGIVSVVLTVIGVLSVWPATAFSLSFLSNIWGNAFILLIGILLLAATILIGILIPVAHRYWQRIKALRLQAFSQVQSSAAQDGVESSSVLAPLPQPTKIRVRFNLLYMFVLSFCMAFVIVFLLCYFFAHPRNLLEIFFICLGLAVFSSVVQISLATKSSIQRIEVSENGIATYMNNLYNYLRWEDVRLFSSYRTMALFNRKGGSSVTYELAGEKTVVRMLGTAKNWNIFYVVQPKMDLAEFEHWQAQLAAYIKLRTNLSRIDLDNLDQK